MKHFLFLGAMSLLAGCGASDFTLASPEWDDASDDSKLSSRLDSESLDTLDEPRDTDAIETDASSTDSGVSLLDSNPPDSSPPDSNPPDSGAIDSGGDTRESDSDTAAVSDTSVFDTYKAPDALPDTFEPDTAIRCSAIAGCIDGSNEGYTCDTAKQIGRRQVKGAGYSWSAEHFSTAPVAPITDGSPGCPAAGPDRAYRLFMRRGETVTVTVSTTSWSSGTYQSMFWEEHSCTSNTCAGAYFQCGSSASFAPTTSSHVATSDGWITIVISGRTTTDVGFYDLKVALAGCAESLCECG